MHLFNRSIFVLLILSFGISSYGQQVHEADIDNEEFFKSTPLIYGNEPDWVQMMYENHPNVYEVEKAYIKYHSTNVFQKNIHTQNYKYWLRAIRNFTTADGDVDFISDSQEKALFKQFKSQRTTNSNTDIWINVGPNQTYKNDGSLDIRPTQANVYCIAVAPSNPNVLYCGSESGGLFKTIDKGLQWTLIVKDEVITNAADIKVHPQNENILLIAFKNDIFKSIDGGESIIKVFKGNAKVEHFYYSDKNPNTIFAATAKGLLKSIDQGVTWSLTITEKCWDIVGHPTNPNIIYLSLHNKLTNRAEVYKSINGGETWIPKTNNWYLPNDIQNARDIGCKIAVSKADPNRIYACLIGESKANDNGWIGIYYSLDGGDNWVNADGIDGGPYVSGNDASTNWFVAGYSSGYHQGWYNFDLAVSDNNPDKLWLGTIWFCESENRGKNIEYIRGTRSLEMHADIQDIDVIGDDIWIVSDGGINYSNDECQTVETRNNGISASNFWGFSHGWNEDTWTGGRYHNGDAVYHENFELGNTMFMGGAEASTGYINPMNNLLSYYSDINSIITPDSLNIKSKAFSKLALYPNESYSTLNSSEIEHDPRYANVMFLGRDNSFYKSMDAGGSFEELFTFPQDSRVLEFEISRNNPNVIYLIAKNNGCKLYKSVDGGNSFQLSTALPTNNRSTYDISLDPDNENNLWLILHNGNNGKKVFNTKDGGKTWINNTTKVLDNHRIFDVVYQGGTDDLVYIVTSNALFYWDSINHIWEIYTEGLPFVIAPLKMIPFYRDNKLRLSSSRGIWEAPFVVNSKPIAQPITLKSHVNCYRKKVTFEDYSILNHDNAKWNWQFPGADKISSTTIRNPIVNYNSPGSYDVTLTVEDNMGNSSTKTVKNMIVVEDDYCTVDRDPLMALSCYGSNIYAENNTIEIDSVDHFTFTAWIKPDGIQSDYTGIFSMGTVNAQKSVLNFRGGNNTLGFHWNSGHWGWNSNLIVPKNEWSFVAMTVTPTEVMLYVNDKMAKRAVSASPIHIRQLLLGTYYGWTSRNYQGQIEEASFWNRILTTDEIRLARHLTKENISDPNLIAYYQFNNEDAGTVYDKTKTNDLILKGAQLVHSTAPVGAGKSQKIDIINAGIYDFDTVNVQLEFDEMGILPEGEIVVTELSISTDDILVDNALNKMYWIINNYGENKQLDSIVLLKFKNVDQLDKISDPIYLSLFQRPENSGDLQAWNKIVVANDIIKKDRTVLFPGSKISSLEQFYIASDQVLHSNNKIKSVQNKYVYPNPIIQGDELFISSSSENLTFTLFDENGIEIFKQRISDDSELVIPNIANGMYFYKIKTSTKLYSGKLIVQ